MTRPTSQAVLVAAGKNGEVAAKLESVDVRFDGRTVLKDVSFQVRRDEFVVIVGRSGCGKTTVLNLMIGFLHPSAGRVKVLGGDPARMRDRVAYMFARDALMPWRTALRNVELGLEMKGTPRDERRRLSLQRLAALGLGDKAEQLPRQLSQGMRQRVALARTWVTAPSLLLMDEPFAALDAMTRQAVQDEFLRTWQESKIAVIFVTHDLGEAIVMADRILIMGQGGILDDLAVPFDRPRRLAALVDDDRYKEILRRLTEKLHGDVSRQ